MSGHILFYDSLCARMISRRQATQENNCFQPRTKAEMTKSFLINTSIMAVAAVFMFNATPAKAWGENPDGSGGYGHTPGTTQTQPQRPETPQRPQQSQSGWGGDSSDYHPTRRPYPRPEYYPLPEHHVIIIPRRPRYDDDDDYYQPRRPRRPEDSYGAGGYYPTQNQYRPSRPSEDEWGGNSRPSRPSGGGEWGGSSGNSSSKPAWGSPGNSGYGGGQN